MFGGLEDQVEELVISALGVCAQTHRIRAIGVMAGALILCRVTLMES